MRSWMPLAPERASSIAGEVDAFWWFLVGLSLFFVALIAGLELYFAIRYRRRSPNEIPRPIRPSVRLEVVWIAVPFTLTMVIFGWGASLYYAMYRMPEDALEIYVVGKQWMWKLQHPAGKQEVNELHVPLGRKVRLIMTSEDVIHDFFVPAFRVKTDVLPGRYTSIWFEPTRPGRYRLFCAEYCGTDHAKMGGWVEVLEPAAYQAWLGGAAAAGSLTASGQRLFEQFACHTCHRQDEESRGPLLDGLYGRTVQLAGGRTVVADETYIRESILAPQAKVVAGYEAPVLMPTFQGQLNEAQLAQLVAYVKSLARDAEPRGGEAP